jgi:putative ABC transport system permease protein
VVTEIVLAFVLLVAAVLLMRSFAHLLDIDPGFDASNVLTAGLPLGHVEHRDPAELTAYLDAIRDAVSAVPGVRAVAMTSALPLQGWSYGVPYTVAGREVVDRPNRRRAFVKTISPSYVDALGIKLLAGRGLSDNDTPSAPLVAVINETFARREFQDEDPIGRRILAQTLVPGETQLGPEVSWEIVGVIAGEKVTGPGDAISAGMYVSNRQSPTYDVHLIVRAGIPPLLLGKAVQSAVQRVDSNQALSDVRTLEQIVHDSILGNRVMSMLLAIFAGVALLLAVVGIYGVMAFTTAERAHEMGIRAALGAGAAHLRGLIVRAGLRMTLIGLLVGLFVTVPATDLMASILYGVESDDPLTIAVVAVTLLAVAGLACLLPAWRMAKTAPIEALRSS